MKLEEATQQILTGDVLLFEGVSPFARMVKVRTLSRFSHVGIVVRVQVWNTTRLAVLEALEFWGVRLHPLESYLAECSRRGERVHWYKVCDPLVSRFKVAEWALKAWGERYASFWQLLTSFGLLTSWIRRKLGFQVTDTDPDRFFCSELVADALAHAGYLPEPGTRVPGHRTTPGDIALYPCLQKMGILEP